MEIELIELEPISDVMPCDKCAQSFEVDKLRKSRGGRVFCRGCMPKFFPPIWKCATCQQEYDRDGVIDGERHFCDVCWARLQKRAQATVSADSGAGAGVFGEWFPKIVAAIIAYAFLSSLFTGGSRGSRTPAPAGSGRRESSGDYARRMDEARQDAQFDNFRGR